MKTASLSHRQLGQCFTEAFHSEHREICDALVALQKAFEACNTKRISKLLDHTLALTGPHFRYKEEAVFPELFGVLGPDYIGRNMGGHDHAIEILRRLARLGGKPRLTDKDIAEAGRLVQSVLQQVSSCDGLSVIVERLPAARIQAILEAREQAHRVGLDLFQWADLIRKRRVF